MTMMLMAMLTMNLRVYHCTIVSLSFHLSGWCPFWSLHPIPLSTHLRPRWTILPISLRQKYFYQYFPMLIDWPGGKKLLQNSNSICWCFSPMFAMFISNVFSHQATQQQRCFYQYFLIFSINVFQSLLALIFFHGRPRGSSNVFTKWTHSGAGSCHGLATGTPPNVNFILLVLEMVVFLDAFF